MRLLRLGAAPAGAVGLALATIASLSLFPEPTADPVVPVCFLCSDRAVADAILNVGFYVPLGAALGMTRARFLWGILAACLVSVSMELAQLAIPGRFPSPLDVLTNTAGTAVGLIAVRTLPRWIRPSARGGLALSVVSSGVFLAACLATAFFTTPDLPAGTYVGQWTPSLGRYETYRGSVHDVSVGPYSLPSTALDGSDNVRRLITSGEPIRIWATAGPPPSSVAPVFALVRQFNTQLIMVGATGDDIVLRVRQRAADWRLSQPSLVAHGLMADVRAGSELRIDVWRTPDNTCVRVNGRSDCSLTPTIGEGWGLLLNASAPSPTEQLLLATGWLALLTLPVGFWASTGGLRATVGPAIVVAAGALVPRLTSLSATQPEEWLAITIGLGAGLGSHRLMGLGSA